MLCAWLAVLFVFCGQAVAAGAFVAGKTCPDGCSKIPVDQAPPGNEVSVSESGWFRAIDGPEMGDAVIVAQKPRICPETGRPLPPAETEDGRTYEETVEREVPEERYEEEPVETEEESVEEAVPEETEEEDVPDEETIEADLPEEGDEREDGRTYDETVERELPEDEDDKGRRRRYKDKDDKRHRRSVTGEKMRRRSGTLAEPPAYEDVPEIHPKTRERDVGTKIDRIGEIIREREKEPDTAPPGKPPLSKPDEFVCCGMAGQEITYPITKDPLTPTGMQEAPRDPATGAFQVMLHDGAYFHNEHDIDVLSVGVSVNLYRHYKGDVATAQGGLMGHRWDFSWNKRIVPVGARQLAGGLWAETAGVDTAKLYYFNGHGRSDLYIEVHKHSGPRKVINFDTEFRAYVTTYRSPPGQFHEIQRYILLQGQHPFREHVNVEKTERIFYVLREKNGIRYIFNCRGQLIYILSRHHTRKQPLRMEFQYLGPINPLTCNPMLSTIIDTISRTYTVEPINIDRASFFTNINCRPISGTKPIPRIHRISGAEITVEYRYRNNNSEPVLVEVRRRMGKDLPVLQVTKYQYDDQNRLLRVFDPVQVAKGKHARPYIINTYDKAGRLVGQKLGNMTMSLSYGNRCVSPLSTRWTSTSLAFRSMLTALVLLSTLMSLTCAKKLGSRRTPIGVAMSCLRSSTRPEI